jgi:hypothetical protein
MSARCDGDAGDEMLKLLPMTVTLPPLADSSCGVSAATRTSTILTAADAARSLLSFPPLRAKVSAGGSM